MQQATDAAAEAAKKVRAAQKKLRQATDLRQQEAAGGTLNKEQREKLKMIPKLEEELEELMQSAARLELVASAAVEQQAAERAADAKAQQAEAARVAAETEAARQRAEAQRREEEAKRGGARGMVEQMKQMDVVAIAELLGVDRFKYVCPEWRKDA